MATPTKLPPQAQTPPSSFERVEAWTVDQAADTLAATSIAPPTLAPKSMRGQTVTIDIPLDESVLEAPLPPKPKPENVHTVYKRREPIRRDSLARREALLKGKEGSRQRRRWEKDRLMDNPHAQPPLPEDWMIQPNYRREAVPYYLAPLWDAEFARVAADRKKRQERAKRPASKEEAAAEKVRQELRAKLKKARGAKNLLQNLEEEVRMFVEKWEEKERQLEKEGVIEPDSEDDEIVFVGRNGTMSDERQKSKDEETLKKDKLVFESLLDDHGASFGRYLVHSIAQYYGLKTWSVTTGNPAYRQAYIGLKTDPKTRRPSLTRSEMPRPLWAVLSIGNKTRHRIASSDFTFEYSNCNTISAAMCQLCEIKNIAARDRWPKDLEHHKTDIKFLVTSSHDEYTASREILKAKTNDAIKASESLLDFLRLLVALIEQIEEDREKWWTSPQKRERRKNLELEADQRKLSELHKINNKVVEAVEAMNARLGLFVKWSLGMNGGLWELVKSAEVGATGRNPVKVE